MAMKVQVQQTGSDKIKRRTRLVKIATDDSGSCNSPQLTEAGESSPSTEGYQALKTILFTPRTRKRNKRPINGNKKIKPRPREHCCGHCGKQFFKSNALFQHMQIHQSRNARQNDNTVIASSSKKRRGHTRKGRVQKSNIIVDEENLVELDKSDSDYDYDPTSTSAYTADPSENDHIDFHSIFRDNFLVKITWKDAIAAVATVPLPSTRSPKLDRINTAINVDLLDPIISHTQNCEPESESLTLTLTCNTNPNESEKDAMSLFKICKKEVEENEYENYMNHVEVKEELQFVDMYDEEPEMELFPHFQSEYDLQIGQGQDEQEESDEEIDPLRLEQDLDRSTEADSSFASSLTPTLSISTSTSPPQTQSETEIDPECELNKIEESLRRNLTNAVDSDHSYSINAELEPPPKVFTSDIDLRGLKRTKMLIPMQDFLEALKNKKFIVESLTPRKHFVRLSGKGGAKNFSASSLMKYDLLPAIHSLHPYHLLKAKTKHKIQMLKFPKKGKNRIRTENTERLRRSALAKLFINLKNIIMVWSPGLTPKIKILTQAKELIKQLETHGQKLKIEEENLKKENRKLLLKLGVIISKEV